MIDEQTKQLIMDTARIDEVVFDTGMCAFISSEVSFDSSEEIFISYLGNKNFPRGNFEISRWKSLFPDTVPFRYVVSFKLL